MKLKILHTYYSEFENYNSYNMEEANYCKRMLKDNSSKEINTINRKQIERQVYLYKN
jgi:hypothetical protein